MRDLEPAGVALVERLSKCLLLLAVAFYYTLVVVNNITDYNANFQFVRHVLMMDAIFPGTHEAGRALHRPALHTAFYVSIIAWETVTAALCWTGALRLSRAIRASAESFDQAKPVAVAALTLGALLWFTAFLSVGGEWFLMWQSKTWNGQEAAFRMFAALMLVLLYLTRQERVR